MNHLKEIYNITTQTTDRPWTTLSEIQQVALEGIRKESTKLGTADIFFIGMACGIVYCLFLIGLVQR